MKLPRKILFMKKIAGKNHKKQFDCDLSKLQIEQLYGEWLAEISTPVRPPEERYTIRDIGDAYLRALEIEGKQYHKKARLFIERMISAWGEIRALDITPDMVRRFKIDLAEAGKSQAYVDRHLAIGKAAWNHSLSTKPNPFRIKFFRPKNIVNRRLTIEQEVKLLQVASQWNQRWNEPGTHWRQTGTPPPIYQMILVGMFTGMRLANVTNLRVSEIDFENRNLVAVQKNGIPLEIPLASVVVDALCDVVPQDGSDYFFLNPRTGKPFTNFRATWSRIKKEAGIPEEFRFHDLRHSAASWLAKLTGGNLVVVKEAIGHMNISTTTRYVHMERDDIRAAVEMLVEKHKSIPKVPQLFPKKDKDDDKVLN